MLVHIREMPISGADPGAITQPKEFRTGLRIVGSFLKVKLYYNMYGTLVLLRSSAHSHLHLHLHSTLASRRV